MRKDTVWQNRTSGYIETTNPSGYDVLINGSNKYLNFNLISGSTGYGFRDNNGTMEFKNSGGAWAAFGSGGGSGTVTSVSVASANGFAGTVATATTTPAITISTTITGILKGNGTAISAASAGTDYQAAITFGTGVLTALGVNIGSAGAPVLFNGALGTPSSGTLTNATGLPAASVVAGTLGTGAYVMDTKLTVPQVILTANAITASGNAATVPVTYKNNKVTNNSAATLTITLTTTSAVDMQDCIVQILDFSAAAQTITWVNTENSTVSAPTTSNGSTTLPLTVGFKYNASTSKWRCVASV